MAKKKPVPASQNVATTIRDRIVALERIRACDLVPNPKNWRTHPQQQQDAMRGILKEVGYVDALLGVRRNGGVMLVDGHLRAETTPEAEVPVLIVDLTDAEVDKVLLTFDPLSAMAETDAKVLDALLREVETGDEALAKMLADLAKDAGCDWAKEQLEAADASPQLGAGLQYKIVVDCVSEQQQAELLDRFARECLNCKAMIV